MKNKMLSKIGRTATKYSPEILTGIGILSTGAAVILSGKAALKVETILDHECFHISRENDGMGVHNGMIPLKRKVALTWKEYLPTGLAYGIGITALIGSNRISASRVAAVAGLYAISEANLVTYKDKVKELVSKKTVDAIGQSISQDKVDNNPPTKENTVENIVLTNTSDTVLCMDDYSGRYFQSNMEHIRTAMNNINEEIYKGFENWCYGNDLYRELGLPDIPAGNDFGWDADNRLQIEFDTTMTKDGKPCLVMKYDTTPSSNIVRPY